ncbi:MAG: hypothetical protein ACHQRJ_17335 [Alphaproteobacteria bacterium]
MGIAYVYGGLAYVELAANIFDFGDGLYLRRTYAHLMSPQLMAFSPALSGGHHPPPWRPARGGFAYDIKVELGVPTTVSLPGGLSPDDMIWWIAALMRLARYPYLIVPVIADRSFSEAAHSKDEPILRPFETERRILQPCEPEGHILDATELDWVRRKWASGARLMQLNPTLQRAFRAFDSCTVRGQTSSSLLAVWGGLEQLFSPSPGDLRFRVSSYIAAYLESPGPNRLTLYKTMLELYGERSRAAHTAAEINEGPLLQSYVVMRNALVKMIDAGQVPTKADLELLLFCADKADDSDSGSPGPH